MKDFFESIAYLFEEILFVPLKYLADTELDNWFLANIFNWIFIIIGICALVYWIMQLKKFSDNNEERTDSTAHSFLG